MSLEGTLDWIELITAETCRDWKEVNVEAARA